MREVLPSYDQSLLNLKRCVHGFGGAASAWVVEWPVSFFLCLNSEAARSHRFLKCLAPGGNLLLRLRSCPSYLTHCFGGGEGAEGGQTWGWSQAWRKCWAWVGRGLRMVAQGYFTCSFVAEVLLLTVAGWERFELRGSGLCVCVARAHAQSNGKVKAVCYFAQVQGLPFIYVWCLHSLLVFLHLPTPAAQSPSLGRRAEGPSPVGG